MKTPETHILQAKKGPQLFLARPKSRDAHPSAKITKTAYFKNIECTFGMFVASLFTAFPVKACISSAPPPALTTGVA